MTQAELAERVGVRQATISDLETGQSRRIELDLLDRLAKVLRCKPGQLIERNR
jgi:putative transcriptional regulator